jgi:hypothetical protein
MIEHNRQHSDGAQAVNFGAVKMGCLGTHTCSLTSGNESVSDQMTMLCGEFMEGVSQSGWSA